MDLNANNTTHIKTLTKVNLFKDIKPNSFIKDLSPGKKLINIIFIILERKKIYKLKNEQNIYPFLVADTTGSVVCNFYDELGQSMKEGDIVYVHSAYASIYKNSLCLYTPKLDHGTIIKLDEFFFNFKEEPNHSNYTWIKSGDSYIIDNSNNSNIYIVKD